MVYFSLSAHTIFDEKVSAYEKREFMLKMRTVVRAKNPPPRIQPPGQFKKRKLADFATKNTVICLQPLKIDQTFLEKDPKDHWRIQGGAFRAAAPPQRPKVACLAPPKTVKLLQKTWERRRETFVI